MGAMVIEKHFTLDKLMSGPDHKASLDPKELCSLVSSIRLIESALGDGIKIPKPAEMEIMRVARKSIFTAEKIPKGTVISAKMLSLKRPGNGLQPSELAKVIGKKVKRDLPRDLMLKRSHI
jgi:sialic acid synthase SpsE